MAGKLIIHAPKHMEGQRLNIFLNGKFSTSIGEKSIKEYVFVSEIHVQFSVGNGEKTDVFCASAPQKTVLYITAEQPTDWKCTIHINAPPSNSSIHANKSISTILLLCFAVCFIIGFICLSINPDYIIATGAYGSNIVRYRNHFGHIMCGIGEFGFIICWLLGR